MDKTPHKAFNIVEMADFLPEVGFAAIAQVESYWEALRAGRLVPKRSEIDPRGIERALENAFVMERIAAGIARFRVAGSHLTDLMGMEVRGMPFTSFFAPAHRQLVSDALEEMFQTPAICQMELTSPAGYGRHTLEARLILLPLKSDLGDISRAIGCFVTKGDIGVTPRRFDISGHQISPLMPRGSAEFQPTQQPQPTGPVISPTQGPERSAAPSSVTKKADANRPPFLKLVKSDP